MKILEARAKLTPFEVSIREIYKKIKKIKDIDAPRNYSYRFYENGDEYYAFFDVAIEDSHDLFNIYSVHAKENSKTYAEICNEPENKKYLAKQMKSYIENIFLKKLEAKEIKCLGEHEFTYSPDENNYYPMKIAYNFKIDDVYCGLSCVVHPYPLKSWENYRYRFFFFFVMREDTYHKTL